jgi:hypothetical protein
VAGYYNYEITQYAKELYVVVLPQVLTFVLLAMFIQTVVSNKFIGHGIIIGIFVIIPILYSFGWENSLWLWALRPGALLGDYLLACIRLFAGRGVNRSGPAWRR